MSRILSTNNMIKIQQMICEISTNPIILVFELLDEYRLFSAFFDSSNTSNQVNDETNDIKTIIRESWT